MSGRPAFTWIGMCFKIISWSHFSLSIHLRILYYCSNLLIPSCPLQALINLTPSLSHPFTICTKITMDACFLSSNSLSKTITFAPSIKARFLTTPKTIQYQFNCKKVKIPSLITCKHLNFNSFFFFFFTYLSFSWI